MTQFSLRKRLNASAARLHKDDDGVAAIEFAIIAPIMIMMYFGLAEIASAISVDRRISHGANVAGDLATQTAEKSAGELEEVLAASLRVMGGDPGKITMRIESFTKESDGTINNEGVLDLNSGKSTLPAFDVTTLDDKILSENSGIVVTRVAYTYSPLKLRYFDTDVTLKETFMLKPRRSDPVTLGGSDPHTVSCTATTYGNASCTATEIP